MRLFKIFGIQIKISYLIFFILIASMFFNWFSHILVLIIIILLHELAHCYVCIHYGTDVSEIKIFIFGGTLKPQEYIEENPKQEIAVASAGPALNFILFIITLLIIHKFDIKMNPTTQLFLTANITIGLFNLIPILPLDGGRIARGIIGQYLGIGKATYIIVKLGYCVCILLFLIGIYGALVRSIEYIFISFLSIYIFFSNKKEKERIDLISAKNLILGKKPLFSGKIMDVKHIIAMEFVSIKDIFDEFTSKQYCIITITDGAGKITGSLSESEIIDAVIKYEDNITLKELLSSK